MFAVVIDDSYVVVVSFHFDRFQESRDAVIAVYAEESPNCRLKYDAVLTKAKVLRVAFEREQRSRVGLEYEKSVFLELFKDQPEVVKKAKFYPCRTIDIKTGKPTIEMRTKVYEHRHGIYKFEETAGTELRSEQTLDDGRFELAENQAETVMGDCASSQFAASRPAASSMLIMEDVGMEPASSPQKPRSEPRNSSSAAGPKREREKDDSSSDDVAPVDRMMGGDRRKKKAKVESKGKGQGRGSTVGESLSASVSGVVSSDKGVAELLEEAKRLLEDFKDATTVADIKAESMASLSSRIQSKRNGLGKKTGNKKTQFHIQSMDLLISNKSQIAASVNLHKALVVFEKKRTRKLATAVLDKFHA